MERVLVGVDGSAAASDALAWAAELARRAGLEVTAARVFVTTQAEVPPERDEVLHARQRAELDTWCEALPDTAPPVDTVLLDGDVPDALLDAAREHGADLLVVGGRGAGGFTHLHVGSAAHHLAHHTDVPLAIVPRSGASPVEHIVIGVDGSPGSLAAVDYCVEIADRLDVGVTAVYAFEPFAEWVPANDPHGWHHMAEDDLRGWTAPIDKAGIELDLVVDRDVHPVAAIERMVAAHPGSIAMVGTRGLGGFSGLRLGRVPLQLVHHTGAAVILVPEVQD